jgi:AcrR family transcriptional regulator
MIPSAGARSLLGRLEASFQSQRQPESAIANDCQTLRTDAQRNRDRLISAAGEVFAEQGLGAPMAEVARRAEVGIATLFRRFPTRNDLITATFAPAMRSYGEALDEALADPDAWRGFCRYIERICAMQAEDRGFTFVLTRSFPTSPDFEVARRAAYKGFVKLTRRAKAQGALRKDFTTEDLPMLLMANAGVVSATGNVARETSRRLVAYALQSFAASTGGALPDPPTPRQMYEATRRFEVNLAPEASSHNRDAEAGEPPEAVGPTGRSSGWHLAHPVEEVRDSFDHRRITGNDVST